MPVDKERLCRERGICSMPECDEPIAGWCATCDYTGPFRAPKWCYVHLATHIAMMMDKHEVFLPYSEQDAPKALQGH